MTGLLRSELTKLTSVRSTWWCAAVYVVVVLGLGWLAAALERAGADVETDGPDTLRVHGLDVAEVGDVAFGAGVRLHELSRVTVSLEDAYLALTRDDVEYRAVAR